MEENNKVSAEQMNKNWESLLRMFHKINDSDAEDKKEKMIALIELAKSKHLMPRQAEGIAERCRNVINGTYGNTKRPEHIQAQP